MHATTTFLALALGFVSAVSAGLVPRRDPPSGWNFAVLEDYQTYHTRYLALDCQLQHGSSFFTECCHPHLNTQSLSDFPPECTPSPAKMSSASLVEPTATDDGADLETVTVTSTSDAAGATSGSDDGDDDDEDCDPEDDGDDDESTTTPPPAPASTATPTPEEPKTSSVAAPPPPPPAPTTTPAPEPPKPTPTPTPTPEAPKPSPTPASSGGDAGSFNLGGFATFFFQNGNPGACGTVHSDSDFIAAIDQDRYGNSGNSSPLCGKQVQIINTNNGKTVTVTIADDCPTCTNGNSIDLSQGAFNQIATAEEGMVPIKWQFV